MTASELLPQAFHRIAEAPTSVEQLRRFVFALAMRGKPFSPDSRIDAHEQLGQDPGTRTGPYELPRGWRWSTTAEVGTARLGKMLDKAKNRGKPQRYLRNINVRWFDFDLSDVKVMPFEDAELSEFALRAGDVLICEGGEPGRAAVWDARDPDVYFQKAIHRVRLNPEVQPLFLVYYLRNAAYEGRLTPHSTGATFQHLTGKSLAALPVPVPPIDEQRRIVAKVDSLMTLCNELESSQTEREARRDQLRTTSLRNLVEIDRAKEGARFFMHNSSRMITKPEHVGGIRQAIFKLALTGRLVSAYEADGDAGPLLAAAAAARLPSSDRRRQKQRVLSPATVASFALPGLPESWRWARLDEIADVVGGVTKDSNKQGGVGYIDVPYLRVANVQRGYFDLSSMATIKVSRETYEYLLLREGDILFNEGGDRDKLGRGWVWEGRINPCIHQNHVFRARLFSPIIDPRLVSWHGNTFGQQWFIEGGKQTTNLASLNKTTLSAFPVPIPPLAEQRRIVEKVNELMAVCDELEQSLKAERTERQRLLEALLHDAVGNRLSASAIEPRPCLTAVPGHESGVPGQFVSYVHSGKPPLRARSAGS